MLIRRNRHLSALNPCIGQCIIIFALCENAFLFHGFPLLSKFLWENHNDSERKPAFFYQSINYLNIVILVVSLSAIKFADFKRLH